MKILELKKAYRTEVFTSPQSKENRPRNEYKDLLRPMREAKQQEAQEARSARDPQREARPKQDKQRVARPKQDVEVRSTRDEVQELQDPVACPQAGSWDNLRKAPKEVVRMEMVRKDSREMVGKDSREMVRKESREMVRKESREMVRKDSREMRRDGSQELFREGSRDGRPRPSSRSPRSPRNSTTKKSAQVHSHL